MIYFPRIYQSAFQFVPFYFRWFFLPQFNFGFRFPSSFRSPTPKHVKWNIQFPNAHFLCAFSSPPQELRCKEEELSRMQQQQKREQEKLMKFAQELKTREIDIITRELKLIIEPPTPLKRRLGVSKLKVNTSSSSHIRVDWLHMIV